MNSAVDHIRLARAALDENLSGAASDHYRAAVALEPGNTELRLEFCINSLMLLGHWNAAHAEAQTIVAVDPGHLRGWHALGIIEHQLCNVAGAIAAYGRALAIEPRDIKVRLDRANFALDMGDFRAVIEMCAPVLKTPVPSAADA